MKKLLYKVFRWYFNKIPTPATLQLETVSETPLVIITQHKSVVFDALVDTLLARLKKGPSHQLNEAKSSLTYKYYVTSFADTKLLYQQLNRFENLKICTLSVFHVAGPVRFDLLNRFWWTLIVGLIILSLIHI